LFGYGEDKNKSIQNFGGETSSEKFMWETKKGSWTKLAVQCVQMKLAIFLSWLW
jgi:hypothetical protein